MRVLIVSYDLKGFETREDYEQLYKVIHQQGNAKRIQYSTWIVTTYLTDVVVRKNLSNVIDFNDSLFVGTISSYASINTPLEVNKMITRAWNPIALPKPNLIPNLQMFLDDLSKKKIK
jgi:hypothetical protein